MSKREASQIALAGVDIDAPRAKRRREAGATQDSSVAKDQTLTTDGSAVAKTEGEDAAIAREDPSAVKEKGLKLWQTVKDAVDKEGRTLSHDFMRLPSRRQYPDYYQQIKRPIALDEIKAQLDAGAYASFEDVKQDFETCFRNAKRYNIRESQIWKDAKSLHKLVTKEYGAMIGRKEEVGDGADEGDEHGGNAAGSDDEGGKKKKAPNMNRLLKSRLQKLVEKTDESGRVLSTEFMELPNRKQWPIYYKTIKRPQCLENVFKHLKRKEYHTAIEFANDIELVFSNALEFNQDHTQIWDDAMILRDYFRQLMSDLPHPHTVPTYASASETPTKIKLKVPVAASTQSTAQPPTTGAASQSSNLLPSSGILRIPAQHPPAVDGATSQSPAVPEASKLPVVVPMPPPTPAMSPPTQPIAPAPSTIAIPIPVPSVAQLKASAPTPVAGTLQPATFNSGLYTSAYSQHYPNAAYQPSSTTAAAILPSTSTSVLGPQTPSPAANTTSQPPTPSTSAPRHPLKRATIVTKPLGRRLILDHEDGVKTWAMRLCGETGIRICDVILQNHGEDESSDEDQDKQDVPEEEDEEEPKAKRGRGRSKKKQKTVEPPKPVDATQAKTKGKATAKSAPEELRLKLNGVDVKPTPSKEEWDVELPAGSNVVELGESGGVPWRLYLERFNP